jgi:hypothetical protein
MTLRAEGTSGRRTNLDGLPVEEALAVSTTVAPIPLYDVHEVVTLIDRRCAPDLAVQILAPLEGRLSQWHEDELRQAGLSHDAPSRLPRNATFEMLGLRPRCGSGVTNRGFATNDGTTETPGVALRS